MVMMFLLVLSGGAVSGCNNVLQKYLFRERNAPFEVSVVATMLGAGLFLWVAQLVWFGVPRFPPPFWGPFVATAILNVGIIYWGDKAKKIEEIIRLLKE